MRADIERAIRLVCLLTERRRARISTIAEELQITERSAYNWVRSASLAGLPIRLEKGLVILSGSTGQGSRQEKFTCPQ